MTHRYTLPVRGETERALAAAALWRAGARGIWDEEGAVVAWFDVPADGVPTGGRWSEEPDRDWLAEWRAGLRTVTVGAVTITPSWLVGREAEGVARPAGDVTGDPRSEAVTVVLDPGMAFGTGDHPTTRLCLRSMQRVGVAGRRILDVGTGSGILAIAAAKLGAAEVVAVDIDPDAVAVARDNAAANGVDVDLRDGGVEAAEAAAPFDVVVANLTTGDIIRLADRLVGATAGALVVSGVGAERRDDVTDALRRAGGRVGDIEVEGEWAGITCRT